MINLFPSLTLIEYTQHSVVFNTELREYPDIGYEMYSNKRSIEINSKEFKLRWAKEKIKHRDANAVKLLGDILEITGNYVRITNNRIEPDPEKIKDLKPFESQMLDACVNCMNAVENPDRGTDFKHVVKQSVNIARKNIAHFSRQGFN